MNPNARARRLCLTVLLPVSIIGCAEPPQTALEHLMESRRVAGDLLLQVTRSADATNRAVMAGTDESAAAFAKEARDSLNAIPIDVGRLHVLLESMHYSDEEQLLREFETTFKRYGELDGQVLDLAVQNTNLKAQRLSFGPAAEAADTFAARLKDVAPASASNEWRLRAAAAEAVAALREIQALEAPHIAEANDVVMTQLEKRMAQGETSVRAALATATSLAASSSRSRVGDASAALGRFVALHAELIKLSRTNSNVRSLALVLGQIRNLRAACEENLEALRQALDRKSLGPTR